MSKVLAGLIGLGTGGAAGYHLGSSIQKKKAKKHIEASKQRSELSDKLRERSGSVNRRLKLENYYVRKALNELAKKMNTQ